MATVSRPEREEMPKPYAGRSEVALGSIQSLRKQQSVYGQSCLPEPKQATNPSAFWIAQISSVFFILPGSIPKVLAFARTSLILITHLHVQLHPF
jgi:hypothetical protein